MTVKVKIQCAFCKKEFEQRRSNQIYCTNECCRAATNKKIIEKYHLNKQKKKEIRHCECGNKLSKYNLDDKCYSCQLKQEEVEKINLLKQLGFSYVQE